MWGQWLGHVNAGQLQCWELHSLTGKQTAERLVVSSWPHGAWEMTRVFQTLKFYWTCKMCRAATHTPSRSQQILPAHGGFVFLRFFLGLVPRLQLGILPSIQYQSLCAGEPDTRANMWKDTPNGVKHSHKRTCLSKQLVHLN